jgi:hypothetical protein
VQHCLVGIGNQAPGVVPQHLDLLASFPRRRRILAGEATIGPQRAAAVDTIARRESPSWKDYIKIIDRC